MTAAAVKSRPSNLPAELTSFVGRRRELADVKQRLTTTRLLTLVGPGGIGKTRLATRAAAEMMRAYSHGVWLVDLAPIEDPALLTQAVLGALGLQEQPDSTSTTTLTGYLAPRRLLLVLDNCEHLLDACAVFAGTVLRACPEVRILATSRQPLGVAGEVRFPVPSLSLPRAEEAGLPERALSADSVALFEERAAAALPGFRVAAATSTAVTELCRRLEGIPLALELAAVRLASHSVAEVVEGLNDGLAALGRGDRSGPARQQTLGAAIDWSYNLLSEDERLLWARLSVFAGGFDLEATRRVCADPELAAGSIDGLVAGLVEKSVVAREPSEQRARYRLLETMRAYGQDRLAERGEERALRSRHGEWLAELARAAGRPGAAQAVAFDRVQTELGNLWSALDFLIRDPGQAERGLELMYDLAVYWVVRGPLSDCRRALARLLEAAGGETAARAKGLCVRGQLARADHDYVEARRSLEQALHLARRLRCAEVVRWSLFHLGVVSWLEGAVAEAVELADAARALGDTEDDPYLVAALLTMLSTLWLQQRDVARGVDLGEEAIRACEGLEELHYRSFALRGLAIAYLKTGELERAETAGRQAVLLKNQLGAGEGLASTIEALAWVAGERGEAERAATLLGAADAVYRSIPGTLLPMYRADHDRCQAGASSRLGERAYRAAFGRGSGMTKDEAAEYALGPEQAPASPPRAASKPVSPLTRRERDVARLVAEGAGNREIGSRLFISERTVETHVTNMLNKLGLSSRMQLAHWVADENAS